MDVYSNALIKPERSLIIRVINLSCLLLDNDNDKQKHTLAHGTWFSTNAHLSLCKKFRQLTEMFTHAYTHTHRHSTGLNCLIGCFLHMPGDTSP